MTETNNISLDQTSKRITLQSHMPICQGDLPLDWYQPEFQQYAEEYLALPDRTPESVLPWLDSYIKPAQEYFGDSLLLLAHYYMGGEIVKLVERYGGKVADSYTLALQASRNPEKKVIVESAVHFMAETIAILADDDQTVWITNPKAGCTMEMMAKDWMITPIANQLKDKFGDDFLVIAYMNTSGRLKAIAGETGGAVCTSSNAPLIVDWALKQGKRILFVPDEHLGRNTAVQLGMDVTKLVTLPNPTIHGIDWRVDSIAGIDDCEMMLWGGYCGVHTIFNAEQVDWWKSQNWQVLIHPESPIDAVQVADGFGSTAYLWNKVMEAPAGSKFAIGTEGHFVRNLQVQAGLKGISVEHLADAKIKTKTAGCGCATMSRNDPPHLAGMLDLLRKDEAPDLNKVLAGDTVDELSGTRERLNENERKQMAGFARLALHKMIEITESAT